MNARKSTYNIYLGTDDQQRTLVLNGMTGEALRVEEGLLDSIPRNAPAPLSQHLYGDERIRELLRTGIITDSSYEQELAAFRNTVRNRHANALRAAPSYTFILSMDCNFGCVYCYQRSKSPDTLKRETFTPAMADAFFRALPALEDGPRPAHKGRGYSFIGGEPFLTRHKPVITEIMQRAKALGDAAFSAVSNASNLDQYQDLLGPEGISSIQVTVDGPAEVHDLRRPARGGAGTFAGIADNIDLALSLGVRISLRVNVDRENLLSLPALARVIKGRSWHEHKFFGVYLGLVHGVFDDERVVTSTAVLDFIEGEREEHPELGVFSLSEVDTITKLSQMVKQGNTLLTAFKPTYCYAHNSNVMVDPAGRIYTCLETDQSDDYLIGSISDQGVLTWDQERRARWRNRTVADIDACMRCAYALLCGGGCVVRAMEQNNDMYSPYCQDFKALFHRVFQVSHNVLNTETRHLTK